MKVLVIPASEAEPTRTEDMPQKQGTEFLQEAVGGYIEVVRIPGELNMYLNEEGKIQGLPPNPRATALARGTIQSRDYIVGNVVITGPVDDEGWDTGLTDEQIRELA